MNGSYNLLAVFFGAVGLVAFVLPTIIAAWKRHPYFWIIVTVNFGGIVAGLVFGRIFAALGWLAAVILALWPAERSHIDPIVGKAAVQLGGAITQPQYDAAPGEAVEPRFPAGGPSVEPATKTRPDCGETVPAEARICRFCFHKFESELTAT